MLCSPQRYGDRLISGAGLTFPIPFSQLDGIAFQTPLILFHRRIGGVIFNPARSNRAIWNSYPVAAGQGLTRINSKG